MAVVLGTNAGFVTVAPVADPGGAAGTCDNYSTAQRDTSPAVLTKITEVGWWCDATTEDANFELGLYNHNAGSDKPGTRLYVEAVNAKGTGTGWLSVAVDWDIDPETVYWIALQLDNTATASKVDQTANVGERASVNANDTELPATWGAGSTQITYVKSIYALVGAGITYSELSGTIEGVGTPSGNLEINTISELSGTIAGVGAMSGNLGSVSVHITHSINYTRLVAVGSDQFYYEDI